MTDAFPDFAWAVGEEGSDPLVLHEGVEVRVDEFAASGHYEQMEADLGDVAGLGVTIVRYGMPWRRAEIAPGEYDWSLWDRALGACDAMRCVPWSTSATSAFPTTTAASPTRPGWKGSAATSTRSWRGIPTPSGSRPSTNRLLTPRCPGSSGSGTTGAASGELLIVGALTPEPLAPSR
jgi:hypothetical protein